MLKKFNLFTAKLLTKTIKIMKKYTAIVVMLKNGFNYAYSFNAENNDEARKYINNKFDLNSAVVNFIEGDYTLNTHLIKQL